MNYTMTTPCDQCPFLKKMARGFTLRRLEEFAEGPFPCHKTLADIYTLLKRSHYRRTGLRLNNEQVHVLFNQASQDADATATEIADYLFTNGIGEKAKRLVIELENGLTSGGWCKEAVKDAIAKILKREAQP